MGETARQYIPPDHIPPVADTFNPEETTGGIEGVLKEFGEEKKPIPDRPVKSFSVNRERPGSNTDIKVIERMPVDLRQDPVSGDVDEFGSKLIPDHEKNQLGDDDVTKAGQKNPKAK